MKLQIRVEMKMVSWQGWRHVVVMAKAARVLNLKFQNWNVLSKCCYYEEAILILFILGSAAISKHTIRNIFGFF